MWNMGGIFWDFGGIGGKYEGFGREMSGISWDIIGEMLCVGCGRYVCGLWVGNS